MEVNLKLEQDEMEGVDEREWVSIILVNMFNYPQVGPSTSVRTTLRVVLVALQAFTSSGTTHMKSRFQILLSVIAL